jgi:hypothetical protein
MKRRFLARVFVRHRFNLLNISLGFGYRFCRIIRHLNSGIELTPESLEMKNDRHMFWQPTGTTR